MGVVVYLSDARRARALRDEHRQWIARTWADFERVLRRKGDTAQRIALLKRDVLGA